MTKHYTLLFILILNVLSFSCEDEEKNTPEEFNPVLISNATSKGSKYSLRLYAKDTLYEGYNKLLFELKEAKSDTKINQANLKLTPLMHMVSKTHGAPTENPDNLVAESGFFEGAVIFIMPSNPDEYWTIEVAVDVNGEKDTILLPIPVVKNPSEPKKINITSAIDGTVYFVSLIEPSDPEVGVNDLEFSVHYKENMMSFPAAEDLTVEIEPEMPSMDHGSPNNVHPGHIINGHYEGKVNFTMTGWWRVHLTIKKNNEIVTDEAYFDITF
jgi:hypothetical protein